MSELLQKFSIQELLSSSGSLQEKLWQEAASLREIHFGKEVFIRGVLEISNYCRQNCDYCGMRRENRELERYRLNEQTAWEHLTSIAPSSVRDINFQTGEDVVGIRETVLPLMKRIRQETAYGVSLCLGTLDFQLYDELRAAGADFYIIKIETGNSTHFQQIHAPGSLEKRVESIRYLANSGWWVSSGYISGLPFQMSDHVLETLELLKSLPLAGNSVSPFVPGENTPFTQNKMMTGVEALNSIAVLRLMSPDRIIPAVSAFNIVDKEGYTKALRAGANLATINLTPETQRDEYQLYTKKRVIMSEERVLKSIEQAGLKPSSKSMIEVLKSRKTRLG